MAPPRVCPPGKILNPVSNRCVLADGKIGKRIQREQAMAADAYAHKQAREPFCPQGKIYNVQTDRCVSVSGKPGRRIVDHVLGPQNPVLQALPREVALEIWGYAYERPKNCGMLVLTLKNMDMPANKLVLQRSVVKTLQQVQRILRLGHFTKFASVNHGNEWKSPMAWTSQLLESARRRNVTMHHLVGYCRQVVAIKKEVAAMVEQLQLSLKMAEEYLQTGSLSPNFTGDLRLRNSDLPRIQRLSPSRPSDVFIIRRVIRSFKKKMAKDQLALSILRQPINIL